MININALEETIFSGYVYLNQPRADKKKWVIKGFVVCKNRMERKFKENYISLGNLNLGLSLFLHDIKSLMHFSSSLAYSASLAVEI